MRIEKIYQNRIKPRIEDIRKWRRRGYTIENICKLLKISMSSVYRLRKKYSDFDNALEEGKEQLLIRLEESLYARAKGYDVVESKQHMEKMGNKEISFVEKTTRHIHSDSCLIFALKNLQPEKWRDKHEVEHSGDIGVMFLDDIENMDDYEEYGDEKEEDY
jgi:hypothetical protein